MFSQTIAIIKWLRQGWKSAFTVLFILILLNYALAATNWHKLSPGLLYQDLNDSYLSPWSHIHAFRIDLNSNQLALVMAKDLAMKHASADEYAQHSKALITINGGFFDHNFHPLGLRINNKKQQSPLKQISWWGVFYIKNNKAYLKNVRQFRRNKHIEFAMQSGPRLLINGQIPPLKPGRAERSALGITADGQVIILVTENTPLSTTELAQLMKAPPLNCVNALNLDGGSSSQLHAEVDSFRLNVHGFSNVSDAIIVKKKH
ncbi:Exopolysaccharide biosynthesis protein related to N-acetylglucosamine-1-phosphodiester alpha-N-acetylglucosaminidase [Legionella beliardensis]|uniref:Exopolysaccharide biosynthesis protein related to N-acetylglucosamine-1-phosphodiester alpha-N-acetylglucosaminidase n=1 Tax=Legionella beliardensis TaxID=91822 RepID=A0A378I328_9GAMM|nr:phosphodiester glycosidase family protein [Legionella beliardensis]STX29393.1 Exopolysaccharide biosynthesis protein related to N-acetylglucosamine-1-phosphodiester alpha-N-acetylglucosaminidase [Legionella beliardensis]